MALISIGTSSSDGMSSPPPETGSQPAPPAFSSPIVPPVSAPPDNAKAQNIQVTEKAIRRIRSAMAKEHVSAEQGGLRVGISGGGCSGLSYTIRFDSQARERDRVYVYEQDGERVQIFVDPKSFLYLSGMTLDFEETLMRQGFNFVNPHSTRSCGCGSSFSA